MYLQDIFIEESPATKGRVRLVGEVVYDSAAGRPELYWFEFPERCAKFLSKSGNPWLACLVPLAVTVGESLRIPYPVDRVLYENIQELMRIWKCWYPHLHIVPIEAELTDQGGQEKPSKTATFFSGGVDSFFTVLHYNASTHSNDGNHVDDLLLVWGFDIFLNHSDAFMRMKETLRPAASDLGAELIDVATNLLETRFGQTQWGFLSTTCGLASVALAMEKKYGKVLVSSNHGYRNLMPWGHHPLTDPLLSTSRTRIVHYGGAFDRTEKTEFIAKSPVAMRALRVCWSSRSGKNCGTCFKCFITMTTLALHGALGRCTTFDKDRFDVRKIARLYTWNDNQRSWLRGMRALALRKGQIHVARAIERSFRHSLHLSKLMPIIKPLTKKPLVWRLAWPIERSLLADTIGEKHMAWNFTKKHIAWSFATSAGGRR